MKNGWEIKKLGDIFRLEYGKPLDKLDRKPNGQYPVYGANGEIDRTDNYYHDKPSIIIGRKGSAGEINLTEKKFWPLDVTYFVIFDEKRYDLRFLYHLLATMELPKLAKGVKPGINRNEVYSQVARVPSLPEQRRIVALLDEAFTDLVTAQANAEKNLRNARALFESYLNEVFSKKEKGWVKKRLGDVCNVARGGSPRPIKKFITTAVDGVNWIKIGDATASDKYICKTKEKITPEGASRSRTVKEGDFLLSNSMSFGRPYIMQTSGCIHDGWLVLSDYASRIDQDYLYYVLGSQFIFQQFDRLAAGSTVRNLNIELAGRVEIPLPSLKQQKSLAHKFDALSAESQRLATIYERKLTVLAALKKSLLHQAFEGEL